MRPIVRLILFFGLVFSFCASAEERVISSLGRLEPENGVVQLAGPSGGGLTGAVLKSLEVAEGDWVESNQVVARLDSYNLRKAEVARLEAILNNARSEMARQEDLAKRSLARTADLETAQTNLDIALADLDAVGTDPIAKTDARVVEVFILLDDREAVSRFTNMQVKVEIQP